jgi:serine protease
MRFRSLAPIGAALFATLLLGSHAATAQVAVTVAHPPADVVNGDAAEPTNDETATFGDETAGADDIPGEIAVDLRDDASDADVADLDAKTGIVMHPSSVWSTTHDRLEVADVDPARERPILDALSHDPRVEHAEPMAIYRATFVPDDPLYASKQWHLKRVGAESAWNYTCGRGVTVAVVDTGVACFDKGPFSRGTDLSGTRCEGGWNFVDDNGQAADDQGHGTHVAGTIAQTTNNAVGTAGLAYCATLMPIKVLSRQGFGSTANVAEGIRFAADNGAQIINLSLGGPIKSKILEDAVNHAIAKNVLVVAAAGNSGRSVGWPAAYPGVVAVTATDVNDNIAPFSSRGPQVVLSAPGVAVTQQTICNGGREKCEIFGTFNGTSMASPHVAGVAAMVEGLGVTDAGALRDVLTSTARAKGDKNLYGAGIVDVGIAASRVFYTDLALRAVALMGLAWLVGRRIRRRGGTMARTPASVSGAIVAGVGLIPIAPLLGLGRYATLAMRPLGEWDLVLFGAGVHQWLLLASALPAVALTLFAFASKRVRPLIGGVALGTAALLVQHLVSGDVAFVGGATLAKVWMVANALVCLWLARTALDQKKA